MFGAPFPGSNPVALTYLDHQEQPGAAVTQTYSGLAFGAASPARYIAVEVAWVASPVKSIASATIGGVAATVLVQNTAATHSTAILIALVPTGTTGAVVVTFSGAVATTSVAVYSVFGSSSPTSAVTATSNANAPTATLNVPAGGAVLALASAGAGAPPVASWSGVSLDNSAFITANQTRSSASANFQAPQAGLIATCTFAPVLAGNTSGCFAVFAP